MARVSQIFDVLNKVSIDALIKPKHLGERELAAQHLLTVMPYDLVLLDRGYPAWWLSKLILSIDANFCARMSRTKWKAVRKFFRSGLSEKIIVLPIHATSVAQCKQISLGTEGLKWHLIRIGNDGKAAVLTTSLLNANQYPEEMFNDLYHHRWPIEEDYRTIECPLESEIFPEKPRCYISGFSYKNLRKKPPLDNGLSCQSAFEK